MVSRARPDPPLMAPGDQMHPQVPAQEPFADHAVHGQRRGVHEPLLRAVHHEEGEAPPDPADVVDLGVRVAGPVGVAVGEVGQPQVPQKTAPTRAGHVGVEKRVGPAEQSGPDQGIGRQKGRAPLFVARPRSR